MSGNSEEKARANARLQRLTTMHNDGVSARAEYEAEMRRLQDRTASLRALRLAKEAAEAASATPPKRRRTRSG